MSSNFDFPPASSHPTSQQRSTNEAAYREGLAHGAASPELAQRIAMDGLGTFTPNNARQHRIREEAIREEIRRRQALRVSHASRASISDGQAPISAVRSRPQALPSVQHLRRHLNRQREAANLPANTSGMQQAVAGLNVASSSLRSLLDQPDSRLGSPDISAREYSGEAEVNRRRYKRRKLDGDSLSGGFKSFSYGYRGQVVPGALKMEIVSCDGGLHADAQEHWPENVLRNDKSVYCTGSNKCNIIMCHQGRTTFCLKKIVIKAPERGFTAPIQEGLIFISMTSNDLLSRTVRYQVREPSPPRASSSEDLTYEPRPTLPRILSSREPHEDRPQSRRIDGTAERTIPPPISDARTYLASPASLPFPLLDLDDDCTPSRRNISSLNHPSFAITTDYNDTSGDEEEESSAATLADRRRRDHLPPSYGSSEDDTEEGVPSRWPTSRPRVLGFPSSQRRSRRRTSPSRIEIEADPAEESSRSNVEGEQLNADVEVLAPHARFFIDQHKSMISIKFEPPVSGRFILLKLWSPSKDQNIDIQSITAHGYAGPRFFSAVQPM